MRPTSIPRLVPPMRAALPILTLLASAAAFAVPARGQTAETVRFESHVRPILKAHCFQCHGDDVEKQAHLDLRLARWMLVGGDSGPVIRPGDSAGSLLYQRLAAGEMPPGEKKPSAEELTTIAAWIDGGAVLARPEPETLSTDAQWTEEERGFWSLRPVVRPVAPVIQYGSTDRQVTNLPHVRTPVDAFLLAKLQERGLDFSPEAERATLARRLYFDLIGLPPPPERVAAFVADDRPDAYERLVEELLASPAYGERWARHWLDVAGYADSDGYTEADPERPWAYRYRDWVIQAFNADKPLDEFIVEQLAGDELLAPPYENLSTEDAARLVATGFLRMAPDGTAGGAADVKAASNDVVSETIKIVSTSLLGLTVGCAQCHNHRYDPISQEDYYRFRAIFEPALDVQNWRVPAARLVNLWGPEQHAQAQAVAARQNEIQQQRQTEVDQIVADIFEKEIAKLDEGMREPARAARAAAADQRTPEQQQILKDHPSLAVDSGSAYLYEPQRLNEFNAKYKKLTDEAQAQKPPDDFVACLFETPGQAPATRLLYRGDINQPKQEVPPADLSVLGERGCRVPPDDPQLSTTGRRLAFARGLTNGRHPLLGRVLVNRIWMHHFGRGIVASPGDFGMLGARPTHPELLDWLADELVRGGWSLKHLHRLMVCSTAYRQSSLRRPELEAIDPDNRLLGRMPVRRLEAEAIRDALLCVAGTLNPQLHGPSITVFPDDVGQVVLGRGMRDGNGILQGDFSLGPDLTRRSIYVQVRRSMPLGMLEPFDVASTAPNCELRTSSTVAPQSLLMLNNVAVVQQAEVFAARIAAEVGADPSQQVRRAWQLAFAREADDGDVAAAVAFLVAQQAEFAARAAEQAAAGGEAAKLTPEQAALATFCQALMCSNRFLYVE